MKALLITLFCGICTMQLSGQCAKCEQIRAYNAAHPEKNYCYYDDYVKDQAKKGAPEATQAPADANKAPADANKAPADANKAPAPAPAAAPAATKAKQ